MYVLPLQIATSFFVGGGVIACISFIVERVDKKYAGIILASPTTSVLGLFFLGMATGAHNVATVIPSIFIPFGFSISFSAMYFYSGVYLSKFQFNKFGEIVATYGVSIAIWLACIIPVIIYQNNSLMLSIACCLILIGLTHWIFQHFPVIHSTPHVIRYSPAQKIARGVFIGSTIATIVFLGKTLGPFWGAIFSVFPAAFSSTFPIFHWYNNPKDLYTLMYTIPFGALSIFIYLLACMFTFSWAGYIWGTLLSYMISMTFLLGSTYIKNKRYLHR